MRLGEYSVAQRATHQFAVVLQHQGLVADASRLTYRAKCLERIVRWYKLRSITWHDQHSKRQTAKNVRKGLTTFFSLLSSWLFSWFLFLMAGYGYRFATAYCGICSSSVDVLSLTCL
jgi:hypothetical protein